MKKGAIHIDWVISIGIFLVYIIVLLVLIKPSYKSVYEGDALTTMIKNEFLNQSKIDAGFVVFKAENCNLEKENGKVAIEEIKKKLPNLYNTEINIKEIPNRATFYKANFLRNQDLSGGSKDLGKCKNVEIGEVVYYNGLKQNLNFDNKNFKFPSSRNYKITIYPGGDEIIPKNNGVAISMGEPSSETKVYVLDWSAAKLCWDATKKEIKRGNWNDNKQECEEGNIIINIQVW